MGVNQMTEVAVTETIVSGKLEALSSPGRRAAILWTIWIVLVATGFLAQFLTSLLARLPASLHR